MKTIMIADDDYDYLFQLKFLLEKWGYHVVAAENQQEAEEIIERLRPDLAILDLMMENDDSGFILSYRLKRRYPDVPVIIATSVSAETGMSFGLSSEEEKNWIRADLYLEKGVRPDRLKSGIENLLNNGSS